MRVEARKDYMTLDVRKPSSRGFRKLKVLAEGVHDRHRFGRQHPNDSVSFELRVEEACDSFEAT